ncbi:MAG: head-tail adaptor protein [Caulobacter sp.]|nr:head-tail adaptor protein [Caulobacter sp.]
MKVGAHELKTRVRFDRRGTAADGYGNTEGDWAALFTRQTRLRPQRGGETVQAARLAGSGAWELVCRFDSETRTVATGDRAVELLPGGVEGRAFNIRWAEDIDGDRQWLVMMLESGVADG